MKTYKYILLLFILSLLNYSCEDFLDEPPKGIVVPSSVEDYDKMLNAQTPHQINLYLDYADPDNGVKFQDLLTTVIVNRSFGWSDFITTADATDENWDALYKSIYIDNEIINNIDFATTSSNEKFRDNIKSAALADRAASYFFLVNMYAKHYNPSSASSDLGVPLLLINDLLQKKPRATVQEVYDQIISDLNEALPLAGDSFDTNRSRSSKVGILGFFAKIHLYMGNFSEAEKYANDALNIYSNLYNFNSYGPINATADSPKIIPRDFKDNEQYIWFKGPYFWNYRERFFYSNELKSLFDKSKDMRWRYYANDKDISGEQLPEGEYIYNIDITEKEHDRCSLVSTPELFLIRAEARARNNNKIGAFEDLNYLRSFRYEAGTADLIAANYSNEECLQEVLDERRRELAFTTLNWYDLKRYQVEGRSVSTYTREFNDGNGFRTITLEPGSNRYVYPIPPNVMLFNDLLEQNPR